MKSVVLAVLLVACDPGWVIRGNVVDPSRRAIADAYVIHRCPGTDAAITTRTVSTGEFAFGALGSIDKRCWVEVRADGYQTRTLPLREQSVTGSFDTEARVTLTLSPLETTR